MANPEKIYERGDFSNTLMSPWSSLGHLRDNFRRLYRQASDNGDATLLLSDGEIKAHRVVLPLSSKYFDRALHGPFMEATTQQIDLRESPIPSRIIQEVVRMLYMLEYRCPGGYQPARFDAEIFWAADYFCLPHLQNLAGEYFAAHSECANNVEQASKLLPAVKVLYHDAPGPCADLRRSLLRKVAEFVGEMSRDPSKAGELKQLLYDVPDFAVDLTLHMGQQKY